MMKHTVVRFTGCRIAGFHAVNNLDDAHYDEWDATEIDAGYCIDATFHIPAGATRAREDHLVTSVVPIYVMRD